MITFVYRSTCYFVILLLSVLLPRRPGMCRVVESPGSRVGGGRALRPHQRQHQIWCRPPSSAGYPGHTNIDNEKPGTLITKTQAC
jgi:hypothetical protein